jgi:hypothetical protein
VVALQPPENTRSNSSISSSGSSSRRKHMLVQTHLVLGCIQQHPLLSQACTNTMQMKTLL